MEQLANPSRRRLFTRAEPVKPELRLPWVVSESVFVDECDQCQDCISACETNIIVRDEQGYPKVDFSKGECTFCQKCVQVCQKPLFFELDDTKNQQIKPWSASLSISNKCLAKAHIYCQSCRDVCDAQAISFTYIQDGKTSVIPQPEITLDECTQCGACLSSCPQDAIAFDTQTVEV